MEVKMSDKPSTDIVLMRSDEGLWVGIYIRRERVELYLCSCQHQHHSKEDDEEHHDQIIRRPLLIICVLRDLHAIRSRWSVTMCGSLRTFRAALNFMSLILYLISCDHSSSSPRI